MTGLYVSGESPIHSMRAGLKFIALFALGFFLIMLDQNVVLATMAALVGLTFVSAAGLGAKRLWHATQPLLIWFVIIFIAQAWLADIGAAFSVILRILTLVLAAALVTHTTRLTEMSDVFATAFGFLRPLGFSMERIGFLCAMTIRLVPALFDTLRTVREAQKARGIERSYISTLVPVLIQVLKQADTMSDALVARGFDRWS